ncbi:MAG: hypothetical protein ACHRXM_04710 [Isosphaerales bacterium]
MKRHSTHPTRLIDARIIVSYDTAIRATQVRFSKRMPTMVPPLALVTIGGIA